MNKVLIIDLETENHKYYGAVASPRHPDNYCVAVGTEYDGVISGEYFTSKEHSLSKPWLNIPDDVGMIVAHNAAFEMDWFLVQQRPQITAFLARGGRIFCTAYAEYLLSNQQTTYPSLDETAPKYGGTHKVDAVKILWEQGKLTSEIDKDLLFDEYLIGTGGDIANTRKVFYGQVRLLQERGMWDMALLRMEGLLFNCFAMDAGLHVSTEVAYSQKAVLEQTIDGLSSTFKAYRTEIPDYIEFKNSSDYQMSAWLFGGPIKYKIRDTWFEDDGVTPKYEKVACYQFGDTHLPIDSVSTPLLFQEYVAKYGAPVRYASGKNKGQPKEFDIPSATPKTKWYTRLHNVKGLVNLALLPTEVAKEFKQEFEGKRKLADESPVYSTGADALNVLAIRQEFPESVRSVLTSLLKYAKVDKDLGTYYLREILDEEGNVTKQSGMLQYLTERNIVHHILNTTSTVTTRLSSNRPNMQNIPRGETSDVKKMFTSRFDDRAWLESALYSFEISNDVYTECITALDTGKEAGTIIEADYSALEVVCLAAFSKDKNLVQALLDGTDMHCMRLANMLNEPYADVLKKCKDESHPEHKKYKVMRTDVKPRAFAYQYGATAMGIAFATGCTVEDAQAFIDSEKLLFPDVEKYYDNVIFKEVNATATQHREQDDAGNWRVYGRGTWTSPSGTTFEFRQYPKALWANGQRVEVMQFKPTQMRNYPIQGESGFFVQGIAGQIVRWLISRDFFGGRVYIINQVHDAVYLDCTRSVLHEVGAAIKYIMETLPEFYKQYGYDLGLPFPAEVEAGPSMFSKSKDY